MYAAFVELQVGAWVLSWLRIGTALHLVRDMGTKQQFGFTLAELARRPRPAEAMRSLARMPLPARQRGAFLLLLLALVSTVVIYVVVSGLNLSAGALARAQDEKTSAALAQAREALIGYAAMGSTPVGLTRPGSLPCPDTSNNGVASSFTSNECPSYIGRLPWRTLGLPDLRDSSGERLWYAVTREFARSPSCGTGCPLNSDTKGTFTITGRSPATYVIAVLFAPGQVVGTQNRNPTNENTVAHYLEGGNETGIGAFTFVTGTTTNTFNDRALPITGADIMTPVERRAAREILTILQAYRTAVGNTCNCYPYADNQDGQSDDDRLYGKVPLESAKVPSSTKTPDWGDLNINTTTFPALAWLRTNKWRWVFFYSVAPLESESHSNSSACTVSPYRGLLKVDGICGTSVVLITTGPAGAGRPITSWGGDSDWQYYVDDSNNRDGGTSFSPPTSTAYARDHIYTLP